MYKLLKHLLIAFILACQCLEAAEINGLVLEGGEYSGKTSLANELEKMLTAKGIKVKRGHAILQRPPVIMLLNKEAFRSLPKHIPLAFRDKAFFKRFNVLRTAQLMVDVTLAQEQKVDTDDAFLIQDRHWHTQKFMNQFFTPGLLDAETQWLEGHQIKFKHKVYLTCSHKVRRQRFRKHAKSDASAIIDKYFLFHARNSHLFDEFCVDILKKEGGWMIVDTSNKKPKEIAEEISQRILTQLERK